MKIEVTQDQKQKYREEGMVSVYDLIPNDLFPYIQEMEEGFNHFRTDRKTEKLVLHRNIGQVLHQITNERPIRLVFTEVLSEGHIDYREFPFQGLLVVLVIPASDNCTSICAANTDLLIQEKSLVAVYGINDSLFVHGTKGSNLSKTYKQNGYNIGDRLKSVDSPFVHR